MITLPKEMFSHRFTHNQELRILHLFSNYELDKTKNLITTLQQDNSNFYFSNYIKNIIVFIQSLSIQCISHGCNINDIEILQTNYISKCLEIQEDKNLSKLFLLEIQIVEDFYKLYTSSYRVSSPIVFKIVKAVSSNIKNATVHHIASNIGYSTSHCSAIFKKYYHQSLESYIIDRKISYIKIALLDGKSYQQIIDEVGFSTIEYMNRVFKQKTTITTKQFLLLNT